MLWRAARSALAGEPGVRHALQLLADEVDRNMAMLGVNSVAELGPKYLRKVR
jgi:L-lactate dehydrogenase (cytochrome)